LPKNAILYIIKTPPRPPVVNNQVIIDSAVGLDNRLLDSSTIYMQSKMHKQ